MRFGFVQILLLLLVFPSTAAVIYVIYLLIKALRKYTKSEPVRRAKAEDAKTLGEVLKKRRMDCKMTQEFVAETLGVSRQAVSKWESGASDPSTTNLMALAKLFGTTAEELLKETKENDERSDTGFFPVSLRSFPLQVMRQQRIFH